MSSSTNKRALVTGVTGQDGSYLAELLLDEGYEVFGLVRKSSSPNPWRIAHLEGRLTLLPGDLLDQSSLVRALLESRPHEVYNLAAQSFVPTSFEQPVHTTEVTGVGVLRLLESLRQVAPEARFYQASTSEMFGRVESSPQDERTPFHPRSPYGVAKLYAHWATINAREAYGLFAVSGLLFNHESPRRGDEFVTQKVARGVARIAAGEARELRLGNLDATRDWGHARDYVRAMWLMLQQDEPRDFVIATGRTHSVRELCAAAFARAGLDWREHVTVDASFTRPAEVEELCGDARRARDLLGWRPTVGFEGLVHEMVDAARAPREALR
ncbi:MAG: GDP-mannose 4,6-dehydratase [Planctomycetes bacterium]|nr:GDP-mannose 4,6-dehydratase [Planctomycetota bacterium]